MKARITEIFDSIQGEGIYLGERQIFIRFFGCNLNCQFCDTKSDCALECTPEEAFSQVRAYKGSYHSVSFTGGEPLVQKDAVKALAGLTKAAGYLNYLETNGTLPEALEEAIDFFDIVAMDIKLPSSTGLGHFWQAHRDFLRIAAKKSVFLKAVICDNTQEEDICQIADIICEVDKSAVVVLQPDGRSHSRELNGKAEAYRDILRKHKVACCVIPQIHKIVGMR